MNEPNYIPQIIMKRVAAKLNWTTKSVEKLSVWQIDRTKLIIALTMNHFVAFWGKRFFFFLSSSQFHQQRLLSIRSPFFSPALHPFNWKQCFCSMRYIRSICFPHPHQTASKAFLLNFVFFFPSRLCKCIRWKMWNPVHFFFGCIIT